MKIFSRVNAKNPKLLDKIHPISGDILQLNCGISEDEFLILLNNVNIIFHLAASISFSSELGKQLLENVGGTKNVIKFAKQIVNFSTFVHVSTAFCVIDHEKVEEQIYETKYDPLEMLRIVESFSTETIERLNEEILEIYPNNYCFTKHLAENLIKKMCEGDKLKISIARPSIVFSSYREPFPGWVDNYNGLVGISIAALKGILRSFLIDAEQSFKYFPVDMTANALIMIAKETAEKDKK